MAKKKPTEALFVTKAIHVLRKPPYTGAHVVYSGLNNALRAQFPDREPRDITQQLVDEGVIEMRNARGGAIAYLPGDAPKHDPAAAGKAVAARVLTELGIA